MWINKFSPFSKGRIKEGFLLGSSPSPIRASSPRQAKRPVSFEANFAEADKARIKPMKKFFVYLLLSLKDNKTYLGSTDNLSKRIKEHNEGKSRSTKYRRPLKLIYKEEFDTLEEARIREKYLKTRQGRNELKKILEKLNIGP